MIAPVLLLALAFFAGVAIATGFASSAIEIGALTIVALGCALALLRGGPRGGRRGPALAVGVLLLFALGLLRASDGHPDLGNVAAIAGGRQVELTGVIVADPVVRGGEQSLRVTGEAVTLGGESVTVDGEVLLFAPLGPIYHYGDRIRGTVRLRDLPPGAPADLRDLLQERGIAATGAAQDLEVLDTGQGNLLRAAVGSARTSVDRALARALDEPLAGLAQGIATGRRESVEADLRQALNATSLTHLVVVSGSNVTLLAALLVAALAWLIGRRWAVAAALATIGAYTVFVGADAPVVRAAIMAGLFLAAGLLGRPTSAVPAIALAAAVMVAVSPGIVRDLSFQLSFAATAWLALLAPPLGARVQARIGGGPERGDLGARIVQVILEIAVVTAIATAATLPLLALHFGRISLIALPANLLVAPTFPLIFLGSLLTGAVGAASTTAGEVVGWMAAWLPLSWFVEVAEQLAALPFASARVEGFGLAHTFVLYGAMALVALWLVRGPRPRTASARPWSERLNRPVAWLAAGILAAANIVVWAGVTQAPDALLTVAALDIGQGDALLVRAPSGTTMLVDGGPDGARLLDALAESLPSGTREIDVLVATHPQADHIDGFFTLFDRYRVGALIVAPENDRTDLGRRLIDAARARGVSVQVAGPGWRINLGAEVTVAVVGPIPPLEAGAARSINNGALALLLRHGAVRFMLAADIEAPEEVALGLAPGDLGATVLKVAHHGSRTSTTDLFLRRVDPAVAVISAGAGNPFGHPHREVLERLGSVEVLRTDERGTITFRSDGVRLRYSTERAGEP